MLFYALCAALSPWDLQILVCSEMMSLMRANSMVRLIASYCYYLSNPKMHTLESTSAPWQPQRKCINTLPSCKTYIHCVPFHFNWPTVKIWFLCNRIVTYRYLFVNTALVTIPQFRLQSRYFSYILIKARHFYVKILLLKKYMIWPKLYIKTANLPAFWLRMTSRLECRFCRK